MSLFCINCGKNLPEEARFCSNCGKPVRQPEPEYTKSDTPNQKDDKLSQKNMQLTSQREDQITRAVLNVITASLKNGLLHEADLDSLADFMEEKTAAIKTDEDILSYLSELAQKWPSFRPLYRREKREIQLRKLKQMSPEMAKRTNRVKIFVTPVRK